MNNLSMDAFRQSAAELGVVEFEVSEVQRSSAYRRERQRLYRGQTFTSDVLVRSKVEFAVFDEDAEHMVHALKETVRPDSICVYKIDQVIVLDRGRPAIDQNRPLRASASVVNDSGTSGEKCDSGTTPNSTALLC